MQIFDDLRKSGVYPLLVAVLLIGVIVGVLDVRFLDRQAARQAILLEGHFFVVETFVVSVILAIYDYRRRHAEEIRDLRNAFSQARAWPGEEGVRRRVELIRRVQASGAKPTEVDDVNLESAALNEVDFS